MNNALKKISARAKALKKKHPGKKYKTLQKQAGAEYRAGKLKAKRKPAAKKKATRKKTTRRKSPRRKIGKAQTVVYSLGKLIKRKRRKSKPKQKRTGRRVSGKGSSMMPLIAIAGLGIVAYMLLKPAAPAAQLYQTSNPQRNTSANNILLYATAAGMTAKAIADLITAINNSPDAAVVAAGANPAAYISSYNPMGTGI